MRCWPRVRPPSPTFAFSRTQAPVIRPSISGGDERLQVRARGEGVAAACEDRDVDGVVVAEVRPRGLEQLVQLGVDRVLRLGRVERQVRDPVALLVEQLAHEVTAPSAAEPTWRAYFARTPLV